ncbi:MAG: hypothetical protein KGK08_09415 [Acidobacteriota bacterium]|nr:hypothetical protein [Acidobacteriota bacterium]
MMSSVAQMQMQDAEEEYSSPSRRIDWRPQDGYAMFQGPIAVEVTLESEGCSEEFWEQTPVEAMVTEYAPAQRPAPMFSTDRKTA